jgi:hypothetical protein
MAELKSEKLAAEKNFERLSADHAKKLASLESQLQALNPYKGIQLFLQNYFTYVGRHF